MSMLLLRVALLSTVSMLPGTGPGAAGPGAPHANPVVTVVAKDFSYVAPASIPAGPTTFRLVNHGPSVHHLTIIRLNAGKTVQDLVAAFSHPGPPPAWAVAEGGPNAVDPGTVSEAIVDLAPGNYALVCFVPDANGVPHMMKGMVSAMKVMPAATKSAPVPTPDMTIRLMDYGFVLSKPLTAGAHRIEVTNTAQQMHEVVFVRLAPGKTMKDFVAWAQAGMKTMPPGSFDGGISAMSAGGHNEALVNLQPGNYLLVCFLQAPDGKLHLQHGMIEEVAVK
jgi:hypothetical protein